MCGQPLTFFFQIAFPDEHLWRNLTLAVFACTSCAAEAYLIPPILATPPRNADIQADHLESYQVNFKFLVFKTAGGRMRSGYEEKIKFEAIELKYTPDPHRTGHKLDGAPNWVLDDESPATYNANIPMVFLLQLLEGFQFEKKEGAPPQVELDLRGRPAPSPLPYYQLFLGNALYLFGTESERIHLVYAITQVD